MDARVKAQELADSLAASKEYQRLKDAREEVEQHQAAQVMLRDFDKKQQALQQQQLEGKPVTESDADELRKLYEVLSINPYIRELFEAEFGFHGLMNEVQEILAKTLGLITAADTDAEAQEEEPEIEKPTKKLWTPGN